MRGSNFINEYEEFKESEEYEEYEKCYGLEKYDYSVKLRYSHALRCSGFCWQRMFRNNSQPSWYMENFLLKLRLEYKYVKYTGFISKDWIEIAKTNKVKVYKYWFVVLPKEIIIKIANYVYTLSAVSSIPSIPFHP